MGKRIIAGVIIGVIVAVIMEIAFGLISPLLILWGILPGPENNDPLIFDKPINDVYTINVYDSPPSWSDIIVVNDKEDGTIVISDSMYDSSEFDNEAIGTHHIYYNVFDSDNGNVFYTLTVQVVDIESPIIDISNFTYYTISYGGNFDLSQILVTDNYDDNLEVDFISDVDCFNKGNYSVFITATDDSKNVSTKTLFINVLSPTITMKSFDNAKKDTYANDSNNTKFHDFYTLVVKGPLGIELTDKLLLSQYSDTVPSGIKLYINTIEMNEQYDIISIIHSVVDSGSTPTAYLYLDGVQVSTSYDIFLDANSSKKHINPNENSTQLFTDYDIILPGEYEVVIEFDARWLSISLFGLIIGEGSNGPQSNNYIFQIYN